MLSAASIPSLPPPSAQPTPAPAPNVPDRASGIDWENAIRPPPPAQSRSRDPHQRSRTGIELPSPLASHPVNQNPSRSSVHVPLLSPNRTSSPPRSRSRSPIKAPRCLSTIPTVEKHEGEKITVEAKPGKIGRWFNGDSDHVNLGLIPSPTKEYLDPFGGEEEQNASPMDTAERTSALTGDNFTNRPPSASTRLQKRASASPTRSKATTHPSGAALSRFFFKPKTDKPHSPTNSVIENDELLHLSIPVALFPHGPTDTFSPAAFKNLQMNAEGALGRFQTAYRATYDSLHSARSVKNIQADELEAAETRNEALKMQLSDMAARASAQEEAMKQLKEELDMERNRRQEEQELRRGTVKLVQPAEDQIRTYRGRRTRISDITTSSFESSEQDADLSSEVSSIFSHSDRMTARSASPTTDIEFSPATPQSSKFPSFRLTTRTPTKALNPAQTPQPVKIEKQECSVCHGVSSSEAWDVVSVMKEESRALKGRITELERANEDCLNLLAGLGL